MATIRHPAVALADEASLTMTMQDTAVAALTSYADGAPAQTFTRVDARLVLQRIGDLIRAASAAGWLDEREAADTGEAA